MKAGFSFVMVLVVGGVVIAFLFGRKWLQAKTWSSVADELGLSYRPSGWLGSPSMHGTIDGVDIDVFIETTGHGKHRKRFTVVEATAAGMLPAGMKVYHESFLGKALKLVGGKDIHVGHRALDDAFIIKGFDDQTITNFLTKSRVAEVLVAAHGRHGSIRVEQGSVSVRERGIGTSANTVKSYIDTVVEVTEAINEASDAKLSAARAKTPSAAADPFDDGSAPPSPSTAAPGNDAARATAAANDTDDTSTNPDDWW